MKKNGKLYITIKNAVITAFDLHVSGSAAELSYYFLFSVFPMIMAVGAMTFIRENQDGRLSEIFERFFPEVVGDLFSDFYSYIMQFNNRAFLAVGILLSIYAFSRYINSLKRKMREIYSVESHRSFIAEWLLSAAFSASIIFGLYFTFFLQTLGAGILEYLSENFYLIDESLIDIWLSLRFVLIGAYIFAVLLFLYKLVPDVGLTFRKALPGTVFSSTAWIVISAVFAYYIDNISNYSALYGSIGAFIVLMIWLYLVNNIILAGAVMNKVFDGKTPEK